ncbi:hypothetical protein BH10ACT1_BH10ACT1_23260 [soil metagenome]
MPSDPPGYHLERLLGRGPCEVWLAWSHGAAADPVVLKRSEPGTAAATDLAREATVLAAVVHPNVVPLLAAEPGPVLVLPFLAGGSLRDLLDDRGTLTAGEAVAVLGPVASAVDAIHGIGLVHGDLKPDNVLFDAVGTPVVVDLACARVIEAASGPLALLPDHLRSGTPAYLDPGLLAGGAARPEADVFSLGVTTYELLTGRCPHRGGPAELMAAAAGGVHRPLGSWPGIAPAVAVAVEAAIDPDPERRPRSASAFVALLAAAVEPADVVLPGPARRDVAEPRPAEQRHRTRRYGPAPPSPPVPSPDRSPLRRRVALGAGALAAGLVVVLAASSLSGSTAPTSALTVTPTSAACPRRAALPGPGQAMQVDVDGDGCSEPARWQAAVLTVDGPGGLRSFRLGRSDDQVLAGDWDGDGSVTVAVYRPGTGQVLYVDAFPEGVGQQVSARRTTVAAVGGRARVEVGAGGRPVVRVEVSGPGPTR